MSQAMINLQARKETIDTSKIGLMSGVYARMTDIDVRALEDAVSRFVAAQALIDNVANVEGSLVVRDIFPDLDLLDGYININSPINSRDWRQPAQYSAATGSVANTNAYYNVSAQTSPGTAPGSVGNALIIYTTSRNSNNDRKVLGFYGIALVAVGPYRDYPTLNSNSIIFRRTSVKIIDQIPIQRLETELTMRLYFKTPVLYKRADDANILFVPNARTAVNASKFDQMELLGKCAEPLGSTVMG
jgi:hypothetical protein